MLSTLCFLLPIIVIAVLLDLFFVIGLQRYRTLKKEATDNNGALRITRRELLGRAYFPRIYQDGILPRRFREFMVMVNPSNNKNLAKFFVKAVIPLTSILLLLTGVIQLRAQTWTMGAICSLLGMAGLVLSIRILITEEVNALGSWTAPEEVNAVRPWIASAVLWTIIIGMSALSVFYVADNLRDAKTDRIAAATWVGSLLLGMFVIWMRGLQPGLYATFLEKIKTHRTELIIILGLLVVAFALRTVNLTNHPYPWSGDEASIGSEAARILNGEITNFFESGWSLQSNWSFVPTAIMEIIFGRNILAIRLASALAGTLAVVFVYLAGRELFNPLVALMAGAFVATLPYHLHFSRFGVANVVDSLFASVMFWLIARGLSRDDERYYYSAGAVAGLSIYTYAGTRLILILAAMTFIFLIIRKRGYLTSHWKHLSFFIGGVAISAAPQMAFFLRHRDIFVGRFGQEGIFFNGWLSREMALTGNDLLGIIVSQFSRTTMVFIASAAPGNFFNSPQPYLTIVGSILFLIGICYALAFLPDVRYFILLIWFWSVILFGGIMTINPPANSRMLMTAPVVALFMAIGTYEILEYLRKFKLVNKHLVIPAILLVIAVVSYQNINFYMFDYRTKMYFQNANGEFAMEAAKIAEELGDNYQIFLIGKPRIFSSFPTFAFVAPENRRVDLARKDIPTFELAPGQRAVFFSTPANRPWMSKIIQKYPGGRNSLFYRKTVPNEVLFEYYVVEP